MRWKTKCLRGKKTKDWMKKWEEFKDGKSIFGNWVFMEGIGEWWYTKSLTMSSLFSFEMLFNSTTCDFLSSSFSCLIFSLSLNSFLSFSSLAFLRLSSLSFSSSYLFFFSFFSYSSCSLFCASARSFASFFITLCFSNSWSFSLVLFYFSLSLCSIKSESKLFLKSFSSLQNLARFWMNASPMSMKFSILDYCSRVILNEGGMKCFHMHVFNS